MRRGGNSYFYLRDGPGSVTALTNNSEVVVNSYQYAVFGNVVSKTESVTNPYGYTGRRLDNESGLMYYRARYYDPLMGNTTSFSYDNVGTLLSTTDANGNVTSYSYDKANRLIQETYADGTTRVFTYDANGNKKWPGLFGQAESIYKW